jgi:hypothetical protein
MSDQEKARLAEAMNRAVGDKRTSVPVKFVAHNATDAARGRMEMVLHRNRILAGISPKN